MKSLVGTDIIEVDRIKEALKDERFTLRVFTDKEIDYCEKKRRSKYQHYAARFAAKEAVFKSFFSFFNMTEYQFVLGIPVSSRIQ